MFVNATNSLFNLFESLFEFLSNIHINITQLKMFGLSIIQDMITNGVCGGLEMNRSVSWLVLMFSGSASSVRGS